MNGYLLIDKPLGWSSFDVVAKIRGVLRATKIAVPRKIKVGHTGTLDPLATGLMIIVVGSYCKRAQEFSKLDKTYEVTMRLGQTSTTGDEEGEKTVSSEQRAVSSEELQEAIAQLRGEIMQTPPMYSAIKVDGQRAYKLARAGQIVTLAPRQVTVYSLQITNYTYPEVKFTVHVSSGTYIRSLVEDIGKLLGTGAYVSALRRTQVGQWGISDALQVAAITPENIHMLEIS